ncbi:Uncharacterised protein [Acinetobacter baumannii]|nr:Uncharacterised protein [Acinetobacter baumannii]
MPKVNQGHIRLWPQAAFAVKQLRFKTAGLGKHPERLRHFRRFGPALLITDITPFVFGYGIQRLLQVCRQHLPPFVIGLPRSHQQRLADHRAVGAFQFMFFLRIAAGDHHARRDLHFPQVIALVLILVVIGIDVRQVIFIQGQRR